MKCEVQNDRLLVDGEPVSFVPTPNQGGRIEPVLIVVHFTADRLNPNDSVNWFKQKKSRVSAHLVVGRDGSVTQMVDFDRRAWHCDPSIWRGEKGVNGFSIGIEVDNPGALTIRGRKEGVAWFGQRFDRENDELVEVQSEKYGHALWLPYTDVQLEALRSIIASLLKAYPSIVDIRGHDEICNPPRRKNDPGPLMDMDGLRAMLAGRQAPLAVDVRALQRHLASLGYWPGDADGLMGPRTRSAIRAFQEQNGLEVTGEADRATYAKLNEPDAKPMPTGNREETDKAPAMTSPTQVSKRSAEATAAYTVADAASAPALPATPATPDPTAALESADKIVGHIEHGRSLGDRFAAIIDWLLTPQGLRVALTLTACAAVWYLAHRVEVKQRIGRIKGWLIGEA